MHCGMWGDVGRDTYPLRSLEFRQPLCHERLQFILSGCVVALHDHRSPDVLAIVSLVWDGEAYSLGYLGVVQERVVQLDGADLLSALVDELFDTAGDDHVAVWIFLTLVSRTEEPVLGERGFVGGWVVQIPLGYIFTAHANLGLLALGDLVAILIEDLDFYALSEADTAGLALSGRERVAGHLMSSFGHCICLQDWRVERLFQILEGFGG